VIPTLPNAVPGYRPTSPPASPCIVVAPVFDIAEPAKIAKFDEDPSSTFGIAAALTGIAIVISIIAASSDANSIVFLVFFILLLSFYIQFPD
jgi:hypothetical protein